MKRVLFLLFFVLPVSLFGNTKSFYQLPVNDVVFTLPGVPEFKEVNGLAHWQYTNGNRTLIIMALKSGVVLPGANKPQYFSIKNMKDLEKKYEGFKNGSIDRLAEQVEVKEVDYKLRTHNNIVMAEFQFIVNETMDLYQLTFFMDEYFYSLQYIYPQGDETGFAEKEMVFNSISFTSPKDKSNQINSSSTYYFLIIPVVILLILFVLYRKTEKSTYLSGFLFSFFIMVLLLTCLGVFLGFRAEIIGRLSVTAFIGVIISTILVKKKEFSIPMSMLVALGIQILVLIVGIFNTMKNLP